MSILYLQKVYVVGTHLKCLDETHLMSTHNICFHEKIRYLSGYSLSGAQGPVVQSIVGLTSSVSGQNVDCSSKYNI